MCRGQWHSRANFQASVRVSPRRIFGLVFWVTRPTLPPRFRADGSVTRNFPSFCVSRFDKAGTEPFSCSRNPDKPMAKGTPQLEWCIVRLGEDHNWWVDEVSDPVH